MPDKGPNEEPVEEPDQASDSESKREPASEPPSGTDRDEDGIPDVDEVIGTFLREASLWPVLAVILGSGGAFAAMLMILAVVDHNPFAAAALFLVLGMTIDVVYRARSRPSYRNGARLLLSIWGVGLAFAGLAVWTGIAFST